jgi:hypothetical protein
MMATIRGGAGCWVRSEGVRYMVRRMAGRQKPNAALLKQQEERKAYSKLRKLLKDTSDSPMSLDEPYLYSDQSEHQKCGGGRRVMRK